MLKAPQAGCGDPDKPFEGGVSTSKYFKEFFKAAIKRVQFQMYLRNAEREQFWIFSKAIMQGRTDYERSALPLCLSKKTALNGCF